MNSANAFGGDHAPSGGSHCPQTCALAGQSDGGVTRLGDTPYSMGCVVQFFFRAGSPHTFARASLVALRNARHSIALTKVWLSRLSACGTRDGGRNGEANSAVGDSGMKPTPTALMPRCSAADRPTKAARAETMRASLPSAASTISRNQVSALALAIPASALAVLLRP